MKRELGLILILGCLGILLLQVPVVVASMTRDFDGPYPEWESVEEVRAEEHEPVLGDMRTALVRDFHVAE